MIDHDRVDPARGGDEGLAEASPNAAHGAGLGVLVDIVPNHVGVATRRRTRGGGTCSRTAASRGTPRPSTSTGTSGDGQASASRCSASARRRSSALTVDGRRARATTTTAYPIAPGTADDGADAGHRARPPALRARRLAPRRRRPELPPLLRGEHPRRHPRRGAVGVRRVARRDRSLGPRRPRRRPAHRPPGRPVRPGRLPRPPRRG